MPTLTEEEVGAERVAPDIDDGLIKDVKVRARRRRRRNFAIAGLVVVLLAGGIAFGTRGTAPNPLAPFTSAELAPSSVPAKPGSITSVVFTRTQRSGPVTFESKVATSLNESHPLSENWTTDPFGEKVGPLQPVSIDADGVRLEPLHSTPSLYGAVAAAPTKIRVCWVATPTTCAVTTRQWIEVRGTSFGSFHTLQARQSRIDSSAQYDPSRLLAGLREFANLHPVGKTVLGGTRTTELQGDVDLSKQAGLLTASPAVQTVLGNQFPPALSVNSQYGTTRYPEPLMTHRVSLNVWVDRFAVVRQVVVTDTGTVYATYPKHVLEELQPTSTTFTYSELNRGVQLQTPPASEIFVVPNKGIVAVEAPSAYGNPSAIVHLSGFPTGVPRTDEFSVSAELDPQPTYDGSSDGGSTCSILTSAGSTVTQDCHLPPGIYDVAIADAYANAGSLDGPVSAITKLSCAPSVASLTLTKGEHFDLSLRCQPAKG